MRLVLLRHGRTAWNAEERYQGHTDIPLDDVGRKQAAEAGRRWAGHHFDLAASSPLARARSTAEAVVDGRGLQLTVHDEFMETGGGTWEGLTFTEIRTRWPEEWTAWRSSHLDRGPLGGETPGQAGARVVSAITRLVAEADRVHGEPESLVVTAHGNCLRASAAIMTGLGAAEMGRLERLGNGCAIVLNGSPQRPGRWQIEAYNA